MGIFSLFLAIFLLSLTQIFSPSNIKSFDYPSDAIFFLKKQHLEGEIFAPYNFGGFLIWQYPQKKVFIDGRMPSWRQDFKREESESALKDYLAALSSPAEMSRVFNKYHINTVLWPNPARKNSSFFKKMLSGWQNIFVFRYSDEEFIKQLEKNGWKKIYSDEVVIIYQRNLNKNIENQQKYH